MRSLIVCVPENNPARTICHIVAQQIRLCNNKQYSLVSLSGMVETLRLQAKKSFTFSRRDIIRIIPHLKTTGLS